MSLPSADIHTLIVGAGLTGLTLARTLLARGETVQVIEARNRAGGRIYSDHGVDLGPAWVWPGQNRIAQLLTQLGISTHEQFSEGDGLFDSPQNGVQRGAGLASMAGSYRISGGVSALTERLAADLPEQALICGKTVQTITRTKDLVHLTCACGTTYSANRLVLAMPPRISAQLNFEPASPGTTLSALRDIPTWMAGHAKAVAIFDTPFWRDAGLSGDAMSHLGPMVEMHDASAAQGAPYALFGFLGIAPQHRRDEGQLKRAIRDQLVRLYGPAAASPIALHLKDWAFDPFTATDADHAPLTHHPRYGRPSALSAHWDGMLHFASSELAQDFGGYLEGALACSEALAEDLA